MIHECPTNDKDQDPKRKKVLQATMDSEDEGSEDCLSEFYFMTIEEEREEDFERAFKELYVELYAWPRRTRCSRSNLRQSTRKEMS